MRDQGQVETAVGDALIAREAAFASLPDDELLIAVDELAARRRANIARDRHCRAPGCTAPPGWCETHHITPWSHGGTTDVGGGILLCQHHHTELHRGALTIHRAPEPATDDTIEPAPPTQRRRPRTRRSRWRITTASPRRARTRAQLRT